MKESRTDFIVGLFVILIIVILSYMTFQIGDFSFGKKKGYLLYALFSDTSGLDAKTKIKIAGVNAGMVEAIELQHDKALVTLRIFPNVEIHSDAVAYIKTSGLLGDKYLEIKTGLRGDHLKDGDIIQKVIEITDFDELVRNMTNISGKLLEFIADMNQKEIKDGLKETIINLQSITADLKEISSANKNKLNTIISRMESISSEVDEFVKTNRKPLSITVSNLQHFTESLRNEGPELITNMNDVARDLKSLLADAGPNIVSMSKKADDALTSLKEISTKIEKGEGTLGKLVQDDQLYDSFTSAVKGLDNTLASMERFRTFVSFRNEYLDNINESKGAFYLTIKPRSDKYYIFGVLQDPVGSIKVTETTTNGVFEREEKIEDKVEFTVQFAKRYYNTALRIGMTESTFGIGTDQFLHNDKLKLSLDAWDFGDNEKGASEAHLKLGIDYTLFKNLFLTVGYDNILNKSRRGIYIGGGMTFEDEDLKYLLSSIPSLPGN